MFDVIEELRPYLGQTVWGYDEQDTGTPGILRTVLIDDSFVVRCVVDHGDGYVRQYPADAIEIAGEPDKEPFDPDGDYDERYNYVFGSSATGLPTY